MKKLICPFHALLLAGILTGAALSAPAAVDPFAPGPENEATRKDGPRFISVCFETFSVESAEATTLYQNQPNDSALYKELVTRVSKDKAKQESFAVVRARSGERATLRGTSELIYPGSYLPVAHSAGKQPPAPGASTAPPASTLPFPVDFQTRNVGFTLTVEPTMSSSLRFIDLRILPVFVNLADRSKWGSTESATETPVFESQDLATANTLLDGQPQLLSTLSRPPVSKVDADSAKRVWFAFVTAKIVPVTPEK